MRAMRGWYCIALVFALAAFTGSAAAQNAPPFSINTFGPTSGTVLEGSPFTAIVRVTDVNGAPLENQAVDWTVAPAGGSVNPAQSFTSFSSPPAGFGGVSGTDFTSYSSGTYTVSATTWDGWTIILGDGKSGRVGPQGTTSPVTFTVTVENVAMAFSEPLSGADTITTGTPRTLRVYWGGATLPKTNASITWSVITEPSTGAGTLGTPTATDSSGLSQVDFSGAVPGTYTIRAAESGCTWCGPSFQDFTITVVAPSADTAVAMGASPDPVAPDGTITYNLTVSNSGPQAASSLTLSSSVPAGTGFQSLIASPGWSCVTPAVGASGAVTCT
ncbi:MAG: hypothetical protein ACREO3_05795, partial [Arenimonas sp.]